jgi:DNA processing protein
MLGVGRAGPVGPSGGRLGRGAVGPAEGPVGAAAARGRPAVAAASPPRARPSGGVRLTEREAWTALAAVDGLGPVSFGVLVRVFGSARAVIARAERPGGPGRLVAAAAGEGLRMTEDVAAGVGRARTTWEVVRRRLAEAGVEVVTAEDAAYPRRLRMIELPPPVLFVRGDPATLDVERPVAVVGTRRPTGEGRRMAARLAGTLAAADAVVVSGLAVGIDGAAHAGALAAGGRSVAVLGSGHARLYPAVHERLATEIVQTGGAVVAELHPDTPPTAAGFPRRNRIIAGLSDATVVVEAGARSGALITASWALEQGRAVFACPGPIDRPQSVGCNRLLRSAAGEARIVAGPDELLEDLGYGLPVRSRTPARERSASEPADAGAILARLGPAEAAAVGVLLARGPATADAVAAGADLAPATVLAVLSRLEAEGLVDGFLGRYRTAGPLEGVRLPAPPPADPRGRGDGGLAGARP